jgi:stringent starvation protein B
MADEPKRPPAGWPPPRTTPTSDRPPQGEAEAVHDDPPAAEPHSPLARRARAREKHALLVQLLQEGMVMVHVDARRSAVRVPPQFATEPGLALNLSWRFPDARMKLNERGIAATLSFGGLPFRCQLPWSSVWGMRTAKGVFQRFWEADLPVEMGGPQPTTAIEEPPVEAKPRLVSIDGGSRGSAPASAPKEAVEDPPAADPSAAAPSAEVKPAPATSAPPRLRLIK